MKEVSPDNGILKGSVYHRLIQRAFPGRFPYDNIQATQPFYLPSKNTEIATKQQYVKQFDTKPLISHRRKMIWIVDSYADIVEVMSDGQAYSPLSSPNNLDILSELHDAIKNRDQEDTPFKDVSSSIANFKPMLLRYFTTMSDTLIERERVVMKVVTPPRDPKARDYSKTYSLDITRE